MWEPLLDAQTTQISSDFVFIGTDARHIVQTQSDLDNSIASGLYAPLVTMFTSNLLTEGTTISSVLVSADGDANNTDSNQISSPASQAYASDTLRAVGPFFSDAPLDSVLFSKIPLISAVSIGDGALLQTSAQIVADPVVALQPAFLAMFSTCVLAIGMVARRRRQDYS